MRPGTPPCPPSPHVRGRLGPPFLPRVAWTGAEAMPYVPTLLTHHRFWMQATWYFQSFWSTFMRLWAALRMMKVSPCVGGCHVRGSPLLPPGRSVPGEVGGNGALLSGPSAPGSGPFPKGVETRPPEVSIMVLWGSLSGPSAPGDCPCTGW